MTAPELKPCPFCGGEAKLVWADGGSAINWCQCVECGAKGPWARVGHDGSGARNWNTRSTPPDCIRRDDPVLRQVMEALTFLDAQLYCHGFSGSGPMRSACNGTIAALKERIGGTNGQTN